MTPVATLILSLAPVGTALILVLLPQLLPPGFMTSQVRLQTGSTRKVPQIGGIAITMTIVIGALMASAAGAVTSAGLPVLIAAIACVWLLGMVDDLTHPGALPKLVVQLAVTGAVAWLLYRQSVPLPVLPLVVTGLVWFMNMVNFMDGMDMMGPVGLGIPLAFAGAILTMHAPDSSAGMMALLAAAALGGFLPINLPPARAYLGDNGSLVLGLVSGIAALELCLKVNVAAAILPFGYYLADSLSTLLRRAIAGENIFKAHTSHAYQMARKRGHREIWVMAHVGLVGLVLGGLAVVAASAGPALAGGLVVVGIALCGLLVLRLRGKIRFHNRHP
ncbi:MAG: hypothetical protein KDJ48_02345 [Nitratireductor sp.]|nr:hypothetical protein [Nitratireductor sp.]